MAMVTCPREHIYSTYLFVQCPMCSKEELERAQKEDKEETEKFTK